MCRDWHINAHQNSEFPYERGNSNCDDNQRLHGVPQDPSPCRYSCRRAQDKSRGKSAHQVHNQGWPGGCSHRQARQVRLILAGRPDFRPLPARPPGQRHRFGQTHLGDMGTAGIPCRGPGRFLAIRGHCLLSERLTGQFPGPRTIRRCSENRATWCDGVRSPVSAVLLAPVRVQVRVHVHPRQLITGRQQSTTTPVNVHNGGHAPTSRWILRLSQSDANYGSQYLLCRNRQNSGKDAKVVAARQNYQIGVACYPVASTGTYYNRGYKGFRVE